MITMIMNGNMTQKCSGSDSKNYGNPVKIIKNLNTSKVEVTSTIVKANELKMKDFMPANDSVYRSLVSIMNVSDNEKVFSSRENIGKSIVTCCDRLDRVRQQCAEYVSILMSEPNHFIKNEITDKLADLEREEIILVAMRDALVKMYDACDTIINL